MALQILDQVFQPTQVQDVATVAHIPVVGDIRIDVTHTTLQSLSMDETSSGADVWCLCLVSCRPAGPAA